MLDCCIIPAHELENILNMNDTLMVKYFENKQYSKCLLTIDSGRLLLFSIKKKDDIDITTCEI